MKLAPCWRWGLFVLIFSLAIRSSTAALLFDNLRDDPDGYGEIAENVHNAGDYGRMVKLPDREPSFVPTAFRPPLYPLLLSLFVQQGELSRIAVAVLQVLLGSLTCWLTFRLGWRLSLGRLAALASILVALDPLLINQASLVMTETLATALAVATLLAVSHFVDRQSTLSAVAAGLSLAACVLCRPTFLIWAALICAMLLWLAIRQRKSLFPVMYLAVSIAAVLLPWTVRNYVLLGKPVFATTHGGYTLLLANNESLFEHQRGVLLPDVWEPDRRLLDWNQQAIEQAMTQHDETAGRHWEVEYERLCYQKSLADMRDQPAAFVKASLLRIGELWRPLPHRLSTNESVKRTILRWGVCIWYSAMLLLGLIAVVSLRWKLLTHPWCWAILLCIATTAVHAVFWSNIRMRAPLVPVICLLAVYGMTRLMKHAESPSLEREEE